MLAMNVQILRHTEYKNTSTEPPQILLSDLRFYCPTSEFTVRPQNLQYDLRIYSTTSESTVRPQNLQYDLRIYSTTSEFYCPTWVFGSSNFSTTWPGGSVLYTIETLVNTEGGTGSGEQSKRGAEDEEDSAQHTQQKVCGGKIVSPLKKN